MAFWIGWITLWRVLAAVGVAFVARQILREGTYAMNLAQFVVITEAQV